MKKYIWLLCLGAMTAVASGCATSDDVSKVERQTATINAELREIKGNLDDINFAMQAQAKKLNETQESVKTLEQSNADSQKAIAEDLGVVKRNQADIGSRMFTMEGGEVKGVSSQIDELR